MNEPKLSPDFTVEDIHKLREWNYARRKNMTPTERINDVRKGANSVMAEIEALRKVNERKVL